MKDRAFLAAALGLGVLSVLVDFASHLLSMASDLALVGAGAFAAFAVVRRKDAQLRALRSERDALKAAAAAGGAEHGDVAFFPSRKRAS